MRDPSRGVERRGPDGGRSEGGGADAGEGDAPADNWLTEDRGASRAELEGEHDTGFDNVFPDEAPSTGPRRRAATPCTLTPSPWSHAGPGGFDGEAMISPRPSRSEASLHEHLAAQLDLATRDPAERLIGRHIVDAVDEAGYLGRDRRRARRAARGRARTGRARAAPRPGLRARGRRRARPRRVPGDPAPGAATASIPAMAALVERLDLVAKRDLAGAEAHLRRRRRGPGRDARRAARPRPEARPRLPAQPGRRS